MGLKEAHTEAPKGRQSTLEIKRGIGKIDYLKMRIK